MSVVPDTGWVSISVKRIFYTCKYDNQQRITVYHSIVIRRRTFNHLASRRSIKVSQEASPIAGRLERECAGGRRFDSRLCHCSPPVGSRSPSRAPSLPWTQSASTSRATASIISCAADSNWGGQQHNFYPAFNKL